MERRERKGKTMTKLMIATPAQNGLVEIGYCFSFARTMDLLSRNGIHASILMRNSGSLIVAERNVILEAFRKSDCTHLLMIDADIEWNPDDVLRMLAHDKPIVGACYLSRGDRGFIFRTIGESIQVNEQNLAKLSAIPAGFLLVSKGAIECMCEKLPGLFYRSKEGEEGYGFFATMVRDGEYWGEDFSFCIHARDCGLDIWVDTAVELVHAGKRGCLLTALNGGMDESKKS